MSAPLKGVQYVDARGHLTDAGWLMLQARASGSHSHEIADVTGLQAALDAAANYPMILENRTSDPASPATGQIWLRTDL